MEEDLIHGYSREQLRGLDLDKVRLALDPDVTERERTLVNGTSKSHTGREKAPQKSGTTSGEDIRTEHPGSRSLSSPFLDMTKQANANHGLGQHHEQSYVNGNAAKALPIAIVGMSCRFPGNVNNLQDMWRLCSAGTSARSEIPKSRFNADAFYHPNPERVNAANVTSGHFLEDHQYGYFDASFFNISPNEAKAMDPRARMHLEGAYEAFENAGIPLAQLAESDTSVFVGAFNDDYARVMYRDPNIAPTYKATGIGTSMLANRISHWFDLKGPSVTLDTACSASTSALHLACESLRTGDSKMSLVSGANVMLEPDVMQALSCLNFLSPDGRTYMFDQRANGYARGEGIGTLILKSLSSALDSNDPVHAVIRSTGMNQDGKTPGITLPSQRAQQMLIEQTYRQAGLEVWDTDFFEAHGTGTQAGDRTEAEALAKALKSHERLANRPLYVGSIKSIIGHAEGASGVAGLIHATLALKNRSIPPNDNFKIPSREIDFKGWNIKVDAIYSDAKGSRIDEACLSQPLCTALQIALVDLLRSWGVYPVAAVGHSSGEIAAVYCSGRLSLEAAMTVAYYRGSLSMQLESKHQAQQGGMMAVGMSQDEMQLQLAMIKAGKVNIACINSPKSVTVSGDTAAIEELHRVLDEVGTFNRVLRVKVAYHSHHMKMIAKEYAKALAGVTVTPPVPGVAFHSSVFPGISLTPNAEYWVQNMLLPVQFSDAVTRLCSSDAESPNLMIEIGPHSGLAGPVKQICAELPSNTRPTYFPSLERHKSAVDTMLGLASNLYTHGVNINAGAVNFPATLDSLRVLTDLPPYPWNHPLRYWHEGRRAHNYLHQDFPPHDLLGTITDDCSDLDLRWINNLRLSELPWLRDHALDDEAIFPAAGYMAMAIEAARQKATITESPIKGFTLREVSFSVALIIPDTSDGAEVSLLLEPVRESSTSASASWDAFRVISYSSNRKATEHCHGLISTSHETEQRVETGKTFGSLNESPQAAKRYDEMLKRYKEVGIKLGDNFQLLSKPSVDGNQNTCIMKIPDTASTMPHGFQSPHVITTPVLDACLQVSILPIINMRDHFEGPLLPVGVDEIFVSKELPSEEGYQFRARGHTDAIGLREFKGGATVVDQANRLSVSVAGVKSIFTTAAKGDLRKDRSEDDNLCWDTIWKPDVSFLNQALVDRTWQISANDPAELQRKTIGDRTAYMSIRKALHELTQADRDNMLAHHQHFVDWAQRRLDMGRGEGLAGHTSEWESQDPETLQSTFDVAKSTGAPEKMTAQVGNSLGAILRKEIDPLSVMMEDNLLDRYYEELPAQDRAYGHAAQYIDLVAHHKPNMKILEIGAGTGSATSFILKALGEDGARSRCSSYTFTDISAGFFEKARQKFTAWQDILDFKTLNIEHDPESEGFEPESYDLIVAANVLHATAIMKRTMTNVNKLLRPGGRLVLVEVTNLSLLSGPLVFGLLPGWWMGVEEGRVDSPLLVETQWGSLLQRTGYTGLDVCLRDNTDSKNYALSTMITTKQETSAPKPSSLVSVVYASSSGVDLARKTAEECSNGEDVPRVGDLEDVSSSEAFYVLIDDPQQPLLSSMTENRLNALKKLFADAAGVLWITFGGAVASENPEAGAVPGFLRVMRSEYANSVLITVDLPKSDSVDIENADLSAISAILANRPDPTHATIKDLEYAVRDGMVLVPRLIRDEPADEAVKEKVEMAMPESQPLWQPDRPLSLNMRHVGLLDSFQFVTDQRMQNDLTGDEVEIEIICTALNFHDLIVASGQLADLNGLGVECSGIITQVGSAVRDFTVGQRVCALASGCFGTHTRTKQNLVCGLTDDMSFPVAASIPSVFSTCYYSLYDAAHLQPGETILIHSAAGGVGQACIKLAQIIGATIFVTVGTPAKVDFLEKTYNIPRSHILNSRDLSFGPKIMSLTDGKGVDVIVNSLAGDALRESWRCIAMFGRFIELGKKDAVQNARLGMAPFERSASFISVGFDNYGEHKKDVAGRALRQVMQLFVDKQLTPIGPITTYSMGDMEKAFRFMQSGNHIGKIVIDINKDCAVPVVPEKAPGLRLRGDASYLIVGGLTGIGAAFAKHMVTEWNARYLILLSRSGRRAKGADEVISALEASGATVGVVACDVSSSTQLEDALQRCTESLPPIRGVIQGAMVLQDSIFLNMTLTKFLTALNPKIQGTKNLHEYFYTRSLPLDFFIMLSSLAGINGNPSQSAYAAGNTYQDALAHHRRSLGLPALTIDVGMVTDVGWSVENWDKIAGGVGLAWARHITTRHLLRLVEYHILNSAPPHEKNSDAPAPPGTKLKESKRSLLLLPSPQTSIGIEETRPHDARFSHIVASQARIQAHTTNSSASAQNNAASASASLASQMQSITDKDELRSIALSAFQSKISRLLDLPVAEIRAEDPLSDHGVDSLVAVEIRNW
ncbi:MAG: hypothetical protein LQ350_008007, partial [Teloschistes chrysophthalmus]